jgi:hypothetical protein
MKDYQQYDDNKSNGIDLSSPPLRPGRGKGKEAKGLCKTFRKA